MARHSGSMRRRPVAEHIRARTAAVIAKTAPLPAPTTEDHKTPRQPHIRQATPETRAARRKTSSGSLPDLIYPESDTCTMERLLQGADPKYVDRARALIASRPDGGRHVIRKARIMVETRNSRRGSESEGGPRAERRLNDEPAQGCQLIHVLPSRARGQNCRHKPHVRF